MIQQNKLLNMQDNSEIYECHKSTKNTSLFYRTKIVILNLEGKTTSEIARYMNVNETTVRKWVSRYISDGIKGLLKA